jgi:hypothetical protein
MNFSDEVVITGDDAAFCKVLDFEDTLVNFTPSFRFVARFTRQSISLEVAGTLFVVNFKEVF